MIENQHKPTIVSLFSGAGGLDRGFEEAGFQTIWANEYDREIWETFEANFPKSKLDRRSICDVPSSDIPDCDGIIGGPPCQSWSEAGSLRGISDARGQLFFEFVRILRDKQPKFFLAENVSGMLASRHSEALANIKEMLRDSGYKLSFSCINAVDYNVPQTRKRVFFVGVREDLDQEFIFPESSLKRLTLKDAIWDLRKSAVPALDKNHSNPQGLKMDCHEYLLGSFSTIYMSRNRVRGWDDPSFTIQAGGRHAPLHPQAPKMLKEEPDKHIFVPGSEHLYRRLSVRECARIQTFPDNHRFIYKSLLAGYKMIGNAVPCNLASALATEIKEQVVGKACESLTA